MHRTICLTNILDLKGGLYLNGENIELVKDEVSEVIIKTKDTLVEFADKIKSQHNEMPDIQALKRQLNNIKTELDKIKIVVNNISILNEDFQKYLIEQQDELVNNNSVLVSKNKGQLILLINQNLPDGLSIRRLVDSEVTWNIVYSVEEREDPTKKKKRSNRIPFYRKGETSIGKMELVETQNDLLLRIKIEDEDKYHEFRIENSLKIYPIVNHINTKYNYKGE